MKTKRKIATVLGTFLALGVGFASRAFATIQTAADLDLDVTFSGQLSVEVDGGASNAETLYAYNIAGSTVGNPGTNAYAAPNTSDTVTNNGSIVERWELDASTITGGGNWELTDATGTATPGLNSLGQEACQGTCPAANQYAIQALFVSSKTVAGSYGITNGCPDLSSSTWFAQVSTVPAHMGYDSLAFNKTEDFSVYTSTELADPYWNALGGNGNPDSSIGGLTGQGAFGDMLPQNDQTLGTGQRGLCVRVTMPSAATATGIQGIQLEITAIGG